MRISLALLVFLGAEESPYLVRDLSRVQADYLVVAPPRLVDALDPLCAHRAKRYRVAIVRTDDVAARYGAGPIGITRLVSAAKPRFLLLAGDADVIPPVVQKASYFSPKYASDRNVATDYLFGGVVGRLPADTPDELAAMIEKTLEYETALPAGTWQKKIAFVTGQGGFGTIIDTVLEKHFNSVITDHLPPEYDLELAYAKPSSPYCFYPPDFNENAIRLLNDGALFFGYVGHGLWNSFDELPYKEKYYPILRTKDADRLKPRGGRPIMFVLACDTGKFDGPAGDSIGEELMKRSGGPVAFIGGSRVTQPYGNALLGRYLVRAAFDPGIGTLGEVLWKAKATVSEPDTSFLRKQADTLAATMQGVSSLEPMRKDVILHYNLLGDPALCIRRIEETIELEPTLNERKLTVRGSVDASAVEVTFECARDAFHHPTDLKGKTAKEQVGRRYRNANNKVIERHKVRVVNGGFTLTIDLPESLDDGTYWVKVYAPDAFGAAKVELD